MHLADLLDGHKEVALIVADYLDAAESVRLGLSCVCMKRMVEKAGFLYGPVQKSIPHITGLSPGRRASYYIEIMQTYFGPPLSHRASVLARIVSCWDCAISFEYAVRGFVSREWNAFLTQAGRKQIMWGFEEVNPVQGNGLHADARAKFTEHIKRLADHAFCVENRRLVPGKYEYIAEFPYHWQFNWDVSESDGLDE